MKRFLTIMMALAIVAALSRCRKPDVEAVDSTAKVRISCTIPVNKDGKTDFTSEGNVNWSAGVESIYLAIPDETAPQIVELKSELQDKSKPTLTFTGSVQANLLTNGYYDVWYFGNSQYSDESYIKKNITNNVMTSINGDISEQSGNLSDLGGCHIAKAEVTASVGDGITLTFNDTFKNQVAIVRLGEESSKTSRLRGSAVIGTNYTLQYNETEKEFELAVTESADANIFLSSQNADESYVVLFPNTTPNVELKSNSGKKVTFLNGVKPGSMYTLEWEEYQENATSYNFVDLGLPSGLLWADRNIGASDSRDVGNYYAWGETYTKTEYTESNYSLNAAAIYDDISGIPQYDAATANCGSEWRTPTYEDFKELFDNCNVIYNNYAYTFTSKINGKSISLIRSGFKNGGNVNYGTTENVAWYMCSATDQNNDATVARIAYLGQNSGIDKVQDDLPRHYGMAVRPVKSKNNIKLYTGTVSHINGTSAVCGGEILQADGITIKERGFVVSVSSNTYYPTIHNYDKRYVSNDKTDVFSVIMTGLDVDTYYSARAYLIDENDVAYYASTYTLFKTLKYVYDFNGKTSYHVDLGLPSGVVWSSCNIGAEEAVKQDVWTESIYGSYFMWAVNGPSTNFGREIYNKTPAADCIYDFPGNATYDAARKMYGGDWRTPTEEDYDELFKNCYCKYVRIDGINYMKLISKTNNNSIYLPFGGRYLGSDLQEKGERGWYLTASIELSHHEMWGNDKKTFCCTYCVTNEDYVPKSEYRWCGYSLRPVVGPIPE